MMPTVSICVPTYNRKDYLKETLDSCFAQTYKDYEVVVVDDGSNDGTEEMIKQSEYNITYHWQENSGDSAARNKLIQLSKGKFITFIDSDDLLMPDAIERMIAVMQNETDDVIVYGSYLRINQDGNIYGRCKRKLLSGYVTEHLFQDIFIHSCGSMFPKRLLQNSRAFDTSLKVCSDYDLWLNLSTKYRFVALDAPTFKRRRHSKNLSTISYENRLTELEVLERFYYDRGGDKLVPKKTAMRRLSKEGYRTGRCAFAEGKYQQACNHFAKSFKRHPNLKSLLYWIKASIAKRLAGNHANTPG
ncbi:MAG: glycosyltransferase family 2 protein [Planctomycetota bacterium]|jgi:glycosyltransferase involved in cell wall biosynthesis